ncbi:hypothetical protein Q3G72_020917 [Acer saccharum]|nr:hypothetical protein Q3G72_020917 [Acer saccharum]
MESIPWMASNFYCPYSSLSRFYRLLLGVPWNNIVFGSFGWDDTIITTWTVNFASEFRLANELRSGKAGVGIIILDHRGLVVVAKASPIIGCSFVELLEAQACLEGLQLALDVRSGFGV